MGPAGIIVVNLPHFICDWGLRGGAASSKVGKFRGGRWRRRKCFAELALDARRLAALWPGGDADVSRVVIWRTRCPIRPKKRDDEQR